MSKSFTSPAIRTGNPLGSKAWMKSMPLRAAGEGVRGGVLPGGEEWAYEPKWDGFRDVVENDGEELALWSRNGRPLLRYFPELAALGDLLPPHGALDGDIVIARDGRVDCDA